MSVSACHPRALSYAEETERITRALLSRFYIVNLCPLSLGYVLPNYRGRGSAACLRIFTGHVDNDAIQSAIPWIPPMVARLCRTRRNKKVKKPKRTVPEKARCTTF